MSVYILEYCLSVGQGHHLSIDFHAHKEKLLKEKLTISNTDNSQSLDLILMARVLGMRIY